MVVLLKGVEIFGGVLQLDGMKVVSPVATPKMDEPDARPQPRSDASTPTRRQRLAQAKIHAAMSLGMELLTKKKRLKHGNWLRYLREKCPVSQPTAWRYMRFARSQHPMAVSLRQHIKLMKWAVSEKAQERARGMMAAFSRSTHTIHGE